MNWKDCYPALSAGIALRRLEIPYIYNINEDELYEINDEALEFLARCNGSEKGRELTDDDEFVNYCIEEGILNILEAPQKIPIRIGKSPLPSLRYLELQLTSRCNLKCLHCYLGSPEKIDMPFGDAVKISKQFDNIGGLRLLISGGEPMLYPELEEFLKEISGLNIRKILITNGTLITGENVSGLDVDEVQFSVDGMQNGHEIIRGPGSFEKVRRGIQIIKEAGIPVSIATMVHSGNMHEFEELKNFIEEIGACEWGIDVPCISGHLSLNSSIMVPYSKAAGLMENGFGGGYHGSSEGYACGRHLFTVLPSGTGVKCGFYADNPLGNAAEDLARCWLNLKHIPLKELECGDCRYIEECAGGCRFRAGSRLGPDPVMCALYGV